jgi:arylsulfatase A-like enzyme/cytochrome c-type biogenesis protein CcmH/NrfG
MPRAHSNRPIARFICRCFALFSLGACATAPPPAAPTTRIEDSQQPERVVLVTIDTLRADYVGSYGSKSSRTPTLDRMAADGVRFATTISPTPMTMPSHTSLMTGLDPPLHGVHSNAKFRLGDGIPTLAEQFQSHGFATAAFLSSVVLDRRYGLSRGFDVYDDRMGFRRNIEGATGGYAERTADEVVDATLQWLETAPSRFFLWIHFYDPHAAYDPPRGFRPKRSATTAKPEEVGSFEYARQAFPPFYAGEIYFADTELGRFLRILNRKFADDRTLFIVTSDHGESLGEHGELTHTLTLYDATQKVPLLMKGPGVPGGRVVDAQVRLVDVAPTILNLSGLPAIERTNGQDLGPWIRGERDDGLEAYVETLETDLAYGWSPVLGLRTDEYKYLRTARPELYFLDTDPHELNDLAASMPAKLKELDAALEAHLDDALPVIPNAVAPPEQIALLESLGYMVRVSGAEAQPLGWVGGADPKDELDTFIRILEARSRLNDGDVAGAREILDSEPEAGGWVAHARAEIELELGNAEEAERLAREVIAAQPHHAEGYLVLGEALELQGRTRDAVAAYEEAARTNPNETASLLAVARIYEAAGQLDDAEHRYREAINSNAPSADAALRLAALYYDRGLASDAHATLSEIGVLDAAGLGAVIRLARAEAKAGFRADALERLERALARDENEQLATVYKELGGRSEN